MLAHGDQVLIDEAANLTYSAYDMDLSKAPDVTVVGRVVASMHEW